MIGLDLSLTASGVVVTEPTGPLTAWTLPHGKPKHKGHDRLVALNEQLDGILGVRRPALAIVEDLPIGARGAGLTGMSHGVARRLLRCHSIPFTLIVPSTLKKCATGDGRADKALMRMAVPLMEGASLSNADEVDAYWLAQVGRYYMGWDHHLVHTANLKELKLQN